MNRQRLKRLLIGVGVPFLLVWATAIAFGAFLTVYPRRAEFEDPETLAGFAVENVRIRTRDGIPLSAWHVRADPDRAVVFASGIGADRRQCRGRAELFLSLGYSVLVPDLRATGKSGGNVVTVGWMERHDLTACYRFLRDAGYTQIGFNGISLGAAAICYALPDLQDAAFVVLESAYDTFFNAVRNRLALVHAPHFLAYPYYVLFWGLTGAPPWRMRPVDFLKQNRVPALILAGDSERELKVEETRALYEHCAAELKRLHLFAGGRHEDFLGRFSDEYRQVLTRFLDEVQAHRADTPRIPPNRADQ